MGLPPIVFGAVRVVVVHVDVDGFAVVVEGDDEAVLLLVPPDLVPQELLAVLSPGVALQRGKQVAVTNTPLIGVGVPVAVAVGLIPQPSNILLRKRSKPKWSHHHFPSKMQQPLLFLFSTICRSHRTTILPTSRTGTGRSAE